VKPVTRTPGRWLARAGFPRASGGVPRFKGSRSPLSPRFRAVLSTFGLVSHQPGLTLALLLLGAALAGGQPKAELYHPPALSPEEAAKQGQALVANLLAQRPQEGLTNSGLLKLRLPEGGQREFRVRFTVQVTATNWLNTYETVPSASVPAVELRILHTEGRPNEYQLSQAASPSLSNSPPEVLTGNQTMRPFAGSDF